jgi:hypothetical protein
MTFLEFSEIIFNVAATFAILTAGIMIAGAGYAAIRFFNALETLTSAAGRKISSAYENLNMVKIAVKYISKLIKKYSSK